jgi:hypothetical protein
MTVVTGILIVLYCLYQLIDIDMFIKKFHGAMIEGTIDAFVFVGIIIWLVIQFFMQSAFVNIIPFIPMMFNFNIKSPRRLRILNISILVSIVVTVSFVLLNKMYFGLNFWTFEMNNITI